MKCKKKSAIKLWERFYGFQIKGEDTSGASLHSCLKYKERLKLLSSSCNHEGKTRSHLLTLRQNNSIYISTLLRYSVN